MLLVFACTKWAHLQKKYYSRFKLKVVAFSRITNNCAEAGKLGKSEKLDATGKRINI